MDADEIERRCISLCATQKAGDIFDFVIERIEAERTEVTRLQHIIDSRPAINAGLPESYIEWSRKIYLLETTRTVETEQ